MRFVLGHDADRGFVNRAENRDSDDFTQLVRKAKGAFCTTRSKQPRIKEQIVRERGYLNKRLLAEDTIDFEYKPHRAKNSYRIVVLRKWIVEERGQLGVRVFDSRAPRPGVKPWGSIGRAG